MAVPIRTRKASARTPQRILADLAALRRSWTGEHRPEGVCDALLLELLTVRPDLRERHGVDNWHR
jgi:hypothetical protein